MSHTPTDIDKHELYAYIAGLPKSKQELITNMIERMNDIVNESPREGHVALGALILELTGISVTEIKPRGLPN